MSSTNLLLETTASSLQSMIPGSHHSVSCALCGTHIFPEKSESPLPPPSHPLSISFSRPTSGISGSATWSSSIFKNPLSSSTSAAPSPPLTPPPNATMHSALNSSNASPTTIYVFRLAQSQTPTHPTQQQKPQNYAICDSGWCLARLRTTCSLWAFIRAGVIDRVWEEEPPTPTRPTIANGKNAGTFNVNTSTSSLSSSTSSLPDKEKAPPLPPRRRSKMSSVGASVGSLWGMASNALKSQPQSPVRQQDKESSIPEVPEKTDNNIRKLSVTVPPPLPRRSMDRSVSQSKLDETPVPEVPDLPPLPVRKSEESKDGVNLAVPKSPSPQPRVQGTQLSQTSSQSSSIPSAADEFTTPVEEFGPPLVTPVQPTPTSAPLSPSRRTTSRSPPVSPLRPSHARTSSRTSLPPLSPKSVPLPDSRPGSPFPARSRPTSKTVDATHAHSLQAQLNEAEGKDPSRAASPAPVGGAAPPVPRRAAARRVAPVPPGAATPARPSTPAIDTVVSEEKKEGYMADVQTEKENTEASVTTHRPPPPPLPRRGDHVAALSITKINGITNDTVSVSDYGDADDKTEVVQLGKGDLKTNPNPELPVPISRENTDGAPEDDPIGLYVGSATWEERTWKEITRLREDMFWARLGAVRN